MGRGEPRAQRATGRRPEENRNRDGALPSAPTGQWSKARPGPGGTDGPAGRTVRALFYVALTVPYAAYTMAPAGNLPADLTPFIGREAELTQLSALLNRFRLIAVTGAGGVGKSRLALRAARVVQDRFRDGAWTVDLSGVCDADLLGEAVADALRLPGRTLHPSRAAPAEYLADRELLLVVDGFDRLHAQCAVLIGELLRCAPGLRVLAAGRRAPGLTGQRLLPLGPLPVPGDGVRLFADRAVEALPGFAVTARNSQAVTRLCARLDGLPLALELAAVRLRALSVEQVLDRLDDRFRLLTGGDPSAPARHRTLRTAIGWSHELCTPAERLLWARLSVFAGRFDLEAAEYVCTGPDLPQDVVAETRRRAGRPVGGGPRGRATTAGSATGCWRPCGSTAPAGWPRSATTARMRRRHRDWYLGLATWCELDWFSPRQAEVAARVASRPAQPAAGAGVQPGRPGAREDPAVGQYLAGTLWFCWVGLRAAHRGPALAGAGAGRLADAATTHAPRPCGCYGYVALLQGDSAAALAVLQECRARGRARRRTRWRRRTPCTGWAAWRWCRTTCRAPSASSATRWAATGGSAS